jgi:hypothetical protein
VLRNVPKRIERLLVITHLNRVLSTEQTVTIEVEQPVSA